MKRYPPLNPPKRYYGYITDRGSCTFFDMLKVDDDEAWSHRPDPQRYVMPSKRIPKLTLPPVQNHVFLHGVVRFGYGMLHP